MVFTLFYRDVRDLPRLRMAMEGVICYSYRSTQAGTAAEYNPLRR